LKPHFSIKDFVFSLFTGKKDKIETYDPNRLVNMAGDLSEENKVWKVFTTANEGQTVFSASSETVDVTNTPKTLVLQALLPSGLEMYKTFTFYPDSYQVDFEVKLLNRSGQPIEINPGINFGAGNDSIDRESLPKPKIGVSFIDDKFETYDDDDFKSPKETKEPLEIRNSLWTGVMDTYFLSVVKKADGTTFNSKMTALDSVLNGSDIKIPKLEYVDKVLILNNNQEYHQTFSLFMGPKIESVLKKFEFNLSKAMDLGFFEILAYPMLAMLRWLQGYVVNWGVAIILLTIIVRTAMFPLAYKSMVSMNKMKLLNPKISAIREKYKKDKERMNKEIMQFYSQHKVNPVGGCLPMLMQIPIFFALYEALLPAIELRHTPFFLWMDDLSAYDYTLILPILMGATMFLQQSLTPNPAMDPNQARMMKFMPIMMIMFFFTMPSGLVLYWLVSNVISVLQQVAFNRLTPAVPVEAPIKGKGGKKNK
ncbi:membrane protein insertase YidC, partial [bacterium]|nr:membrane protein insertase YidC [bacterium]